MDYKYFEGENFEQLTPNLELESLIIPDIEEKYQMGAIRIVTEQARYPLSTITNMVSCGKYDLHPQFQRRHRWGRAKQSRLIESLIMNVPVPPIFLYEKDYAQYEVMDGLQRLTAIDEFYKGQFKLQDLEYWTELNGMSYNDLPDIIRYAIDRRYLSSIILLKETASDPQKAEWMKMIVFDRINSGGIRLEYQESRNAKYRGAFNDLVQELSTNQYLRTIFGVPMQEDYDNLETYEQELSQNKFYSRMQDNEYVLRFFAMRYVHRFDSMPLNIFLDKFTDRANSLSHDVLAQYKKLFEDTIELVFSIFGKDAFRQWRKAKDGSFITYSVPSVLLYDPLMQALSQLLDFKEILITKREDLVKGFAELNYNNRAKFYGSDTKKNHIIDRIELYYNFFKDFTND